LKLQYIEEYTTLLECFAAYIVGWLLVAGIEKSLQRIQHQFFNIETVENLLLYINVKVPAIGFFHQQYFNKIVREDGHLDIFARALEPGYEDELSDAEKSLFSDPIAV